MLQDHIWNAHAPDLNGPGPYNINAPGPYILMLQDHDHKSRPKSPKSRLNEHFQSCTAYSLDFTVFGLQ